MLEFSTEISASAIAAAIRHLRVALGSFLGRPKPIPQDEFGALFGKKLSAVQRWERGENMPPGDAIIKMLQMCPDHESRSLFGIEPIGSSQYAQRKKKLRGVDNSRPMETDEHGRIVARLKPGKRR